MEKQGFHYIFTISQILSLWKKTKLKIEILQKVDKWESSAPPVIEKQKQTAAFVFANLLW